MVIALRLFPSQSTEEDSFLCLLLPNHYMYVLSAPGVCIYELSVSPWKEEGCVNVKHFKMF